MLWSFFIQFFQSTFLLRKFIINLSNVDSFDARVFESSIIVQIYEYVLVILNRKGVKKVKWLTPDSIVDTCCITKRNRKAKRKNNKSSNLLLYDLQLQIDQFRYTQKSQVDVAACEVASVEFAKLDLMLSLAEDSNYVVDLEATNRKRIYVKTKLQLIDLYLFSNIEQSK